MRTPWDLYIIIGWGRGEIIDHDLHSTLKPLKPTRLRSNSRGEDWRAIEYRCEAFSLISPWETGTSLHSAWCLRKLYGLIWTQPTT